MISISPRNRDCHSLLCVTTVKSEDTETVTSAVYSLCHTKKHRDCHSLLCVTTVKSENAEIVTSAVYNLCHTKKHRDCHKQSALWDLCQIRTQRLPQVLLVTVVLYDLCWIQKHRDCHKMLCMISVKSEDTETATSATVKSVTPGVAELGRPTDKIWVPNSCTMSSHVLVRDAIQTRSIFRSELTGELHVTPEVHHTRSIFRWWELHVTLRSTIQGQKWSEISMWRLRSTTQGPSSGDWRDPRDDWGPPPHKVHL